MPVVPFAQPQAAPDSGEFRLPGPKPDDTWSLMAAAQMHMEGRLIDKASWEWSDNNVTGGRVTDSMANDLSDNDVSSLFEQNNDIIDNKGVTFSRKAYDKFKPLIDKLGDDYESIPSSDNENMHVRRMPKVY